MYPIESLSFKITYKIKYIQFPETQIEMFFRYVVHSKHIIADIGRKYS